MTVENLAPEFITELTCFDNGLSPDEFPACEEIECPSTSLHSRSEFTFVLVWKPTTQHRLGLHFKSNNDGSFQISEIDNDSLCLGSPLSIGDCVVSINEVSFSGKGHREALRQLKNCAGYVSIVVRNIGMNPTFLTTSINKPDPKSRLAIEFQSNEGLEIANLGGLPRTFLQTSDRIISLNGIDCHGLNASEASRIVGGAERWVTIETTSANPDLFLPPPLNTNCIPSSTTQAFWAAPYNNRSEFINSMAWKQTAETRLGVAFQTLSDGTVVLSELQPHGLFGQSALCVGDRVIAINGISVSCFGEGLQTALRQILDSVGPVTISAQNIGGAPGVVSATIAKPSPSTKLGIGFKNVDGNLCIAFCRTPILAPGDRVVYINGQDCTFLSASQAPELIHRAPYSVTIVATKMPTKADRTVEVPALAIDEEGFGGNDEGTTFYGSLPCAQSVQALQDVLVDTPITVDSESLEMSDGRSLQTSVTAYKPTPQTPLGLKFASYNDGSFRISEISRTSLFSFSPLKIGDQVVSLNDLSCEGGGYREALEFVRLVDGAVTIIVRIDEGDARFVTASVVKSSPSTQVGIAFKNDKGRLCVGFSELPLIKRDDVVISINGVDCKMMTAFHAAGMIQGAFRLVTIKVKSEPTAPCIEMTDVSAVESFDADGGTTICIQDVTALGDWSVKIPQISEKPMCHAEFVSATVWKPSKQVSIGIGFHSQRDGSFRISAIDPTGLFADAPLCVGDLVVSINQIGCRGKRYIEAIERLRATSGAVTLAVHRKEGHSTLVESSISKPNPTLPLGVKFQNITGRLCLSSVKAEGICSGSLLSSGQRIVSINGVDCRRLSSAAAADMVKRVPHIVTFVTEIPEDHGIVVATSLYFDQNCLIANKLW